MISILKFAQPVAWSCAEITFRKIKQEVKVDKIVQSWYWSH